jgi:Domain of Unknown Function (DUF1080)
VLGYEARGPRRLVVSFLASLALCACAAQPDPAPPAGADAGWAPLFNGQNLDGWTAGYANAPVDARPASALFTVENGVIHVYAADPAGSAQSQAFIQTNAEYSNYRISLEYRWGEKKFPPRMDQVRDAGLLYHVYGGAPQAWPRSVELQIQEGDTADLWAISSRASSTVDPATQLYAEGGAPITVGVYNSFERVRHAPLNSEVAGWNTVEAIVRGDSATYLVNGVVNMRVTDLKKWNEASASWVRLDRGRIALQAEFAELYYRNIRIRPLTAAEMQ